MRGALIGVVLALGAIGCAFDRRSPEFACDTTADCTGGPARAGGAAGPPVVPSAATRDAPGCRNASRSGACHSRCTV